MTAPSRYTRWYERSRDLNVKLSYRMYSLRLHRARILFLFRGLSTHRSLAGRPACRGRSDPHEGGDYAYGCSSRYNATSLV
jgi:hypothetical protein